MACAVSTEAQADASAAWNRPGGTANPASGADGYAADPAIGLADRYRLSPSVALRPEPFGALAYHFGNRRLSFLKRRDLFEVVAGLDGTRSLRDALADAGVEEDRWPSYLQALSGLANADMIHRAPPARSQQGAQETPGEESS